jgi:hypothetical protein
MAAADKYCDLIEHSQDYLRIDFLRACAELLPELYVAALRLPDAQGDSRVSRQRGRFHNACGKQRRDLEWDAYCGAYIDTEKWKRVYDTLSEKLGDRRWYWQVFDPYADKDSIRGDLADDLADIWRDAKQELICYRKGGLRHKEQAVFEWRLEVMCHWGDHHFASAMAAIHSVLRDAYLE